MMLMRDLRGRCKGGMESQVRRPMRTALIGGLAWLLWGVWREVVGGGGRFVTRAKKARSAFRGGQGRVPRRPMPREGVVATMRVRGGRCGIDVAGVVEGVIIVREESGEMCEVTNLGSGFWFLWVCISSYFVVSFVPVQWALKLPMLQRHYLSSIWPLSPRQRPHRYASDRSPQLLLLCLLILPTILSQSLQALSDIDGIFLRLLLCFACPYSIELPKQPCFFQNPR